MTLAVAEAGAFAAAHVGLSVIPSRRLTWFFCGALLLLLLAALFYAFYQRHRRHAESEDRRLIESQLGDNRYWGIIALLSLPSKQVQALQGPLLVDAISPAEIAQMLSGRSLAGTLHVVERSLLDADADVLLSWLQQRASWLHKIPPPLARQWNHQTVAFVLVSKSPLPLRLNMEELSRHLLSCIGAAVVLREKRKAREMDEPLVQAGYKILGTSGFLLLLASSVLLFNPGPELPPGPPPPQMPKDMATAMAIDAATDADGATRPSDAGAPTDGGKHRTGMDLDKGSPIVAGYKDKGPHPGKKDKDKDKREDRKNDKSAKEKKDDQGNKKDLGLDPPATVGGAVPPPPQQQLKPPPTPGAPLLRPANVDAGTSNGSR